MRVSTAYQFESYKRGITSAQERYLDAQRHVSSGKRIETVSDDPFGSSVVLRSSSLKHAIEQYDKNLTTAKDWLGFSESALSDTNDLLKKAYETTVQAANSPTDQIARQAMAQTITEIQQRLVSIANSQGANGQYIFGGQKDAAAPFQVTGTTLVYSGDANSVTVETAAAEALAVNSQGGPLFTSIYANLETLKNDLAGGNVSGLSGIDIKNMQDRLNDVSLERGTIGTKFQHVEDLHTQNVRRRDDFAAQISDIQDVDMSKAILDYKLSETAYSAALQTAAQGFSLSLMDFIKG